MKVPRLAGRVIWLRLLFPCVLLLLFSTSCRADTWPLWESYAAKFLDNQGRVIEHNASDRTTTEAEAYAMFFALVANDRPRFDKLVDWTEANLAQGDLTLHLPAWSWGKAEDGNWHVLDANSAADADLWMAYALGEAGRLWREQRYEKLGGVMADRVAQQEIAQVPGLGTTLLPGAKGFHPDEHTWFLNPGYMPPSLLAYFARRRPHSPWKEVAQSLPAIAAAPSGFVMDWMSAGSEGVRPSPSPAAAQEKHEAQPGGSYDAVRLYLWMGTADPGTPGVRESLPHMRGMATYLQSHLTPPLRVDANGKALDPDAPAGFSAAVVPYLHALGMKEQEKAQADRLAATLDAKSGLYGRGGDYFDQNLALFATGWAEQRYRFAADGQLHVKWR